MQKKKRQALRCILILFAGAEEKKTDTMREKTRKRRATPTPYYIELLAVIDYSVFKE